MKLNEIKPEIVAPLVVISFLSAPAAFADTPFTSSGVRIRCYKRALECFKSTLAFFHQGNPGHMPGPIRQ